MKRIVFFFSLFCSFAQPLTAQNDAVMLAENCVYLGRKVYLQPGNYTAYQLGISNNGLSSFNLPNGMALQVFEDDNYRGRSETFYSSVVCLSASWNNRVSSLKVYKLQDADGNFGDVSGNNLPPQGNNVILYKDMRYSGMAKQLGAGNFSAAVLGFLAGNISSIYIPAGQIVKVTDKNGRIQNFTSSIPNLGQYGWDNSIYEGSVEANYSGGGNGGTIPPQGDRVIFYADMKFSGLSRDFALGSFNAGSLGFLSQNITSIYIPPGQSVKVYDSRNSSRTFTASVTDLSQYGWNDKIVTGIINAGNGGTIPPQGSQVILYRDMKYSGMAKQLDVSTFTSSTLGFLSEQISSIYIPNGTTLQVKDRSGRIQHFSSSISNMAQYGWDNRIYAGAVENSSGGQQGGNNGGGQGGNNGGNTATVRFYAEANYQGSLIPCAAGRFNSLGVGVSISSFQIPPGFAITVYQLPSLKGSSKTFTSSVSNLASYFGWNNNIKSVHVYRL